MDPKRNKGRNAIPLHPEALKHWKKEKDRGPLKVGTYTVGSSTIGAECPEEVLSGLAFPH